MATSACFDIKSSHAAWTNIHWMAPPAKMEAKLTSVRTCTPTPSCPEAPPCTQVLLTECKRKSLPWPLPPDVDHQARIRRVRPIHCPQKMLLSTFALLLNLNISFCSRKAVYISTCNIPK